MDSSQMAAMTGAAIVADSAIAITATDCGPAPDSEIPAFVVRVEVTFDGSLPLARDIHPALASNFGVDMSPSVAPALLLGEGTPPRLLLSDPLSLVLRI
jgi:hypothetical protein